MKRLSLVALLAFAVLLSTVPAGFAETGGGPTRPSALWKAFPLVPKPRVFTPPTASPAPSIAKLPAAAIPPAVVREPGSSGSGFVVFAAIAALLAGAVLAAALLLRGPARRWSRATAAALGDRGPGAPAFAFASSALREAEQSYLLVLPGRMGLREVVVERMGVPPSLGEVIFDQELGRSSQAYVVDGLGPSPLPGDRRPCAILRAL